MATAELKTVNRSAAETRPAGEPQHGFPAHHLTIARYERMIETGVIGEKEPIFLWHGRLVEKMSKGPRHNSSANKLFKRMDRLVPDGWFAEFEGPMAMGDDTMPEPDIEVVRGAPENYEQRVASVREVVLVVEVADSSLAVDSGKVLQAYAREMVPVYWIVNIPGERIDVYTHPSGPASPAGYAEHQSYARGTEVPLIINRELAGRIGVDDVLPSRT